ncbi:NlpC/P60 family protein [Salininema proteolyticum]|uniref:NlpC/P60 family protein n=1 Tax=Salininema proteolyticum TaxID=1607685 RepID=A0ABV8U1H7_9ACTN
MPTTSYPPAAITVSSATLWSGPEAWTPADRLAVGVPAALKDWVASLSAEQRRDGEGRIVTQLLLGSTVHVLEQDENGVRISDPVMGVSGWLPADHVTSAMQADTEYQPHLVASTATAIRDEPGGDVIVPGVSLSTRLRVVGGTYRGWVPVQLPGPNRPGWVPERDLRPEPAETAPPKAASLEVSAIALQLVGIPYLKGGVSAYGLDAGAVVWLSYRQLGVPVPRFPTDSDDAGAAVAPEEAEAGDLAFAGERLGLVVSIDGEDGLHVVHAAPEAGEVSVEPLSEWGPEALRRPLAG